MHIGRGEFDLGGAHRLVGDKGDIDGAGLDGVEHLAGRLEGDEFDRHAKPLAELAGEVRRDALGLSGRVVLLRQHAIAEIDGRAQRAGGAKFLQDGGVGHGEGSNRLKGRGGRRASRIRASLSTLVSGFHQGVLGVWPWPGQPCENGAMFVTFFQELKSAGVPVSLREYLTLMQAMEADLAARRVEDFYYLSRAALVKDERNLDKFDRVFGHVFKGLELMSEAVEAEIPAEWLRKLAEKYLTEEEKKQIEAMGGLDKLMETLKKRLAEQKGRHQGGNKWIGTAGTSPYGARRYNPEGIRIGQRRQPQFRAVKVWDKREFKDLDDEVELGTRNIKVALAAPTQVRPHRRRGRARSRRHHQGHRA